MRRLMILGGTSGIGREFFEYTMIESFQFAEVNIYGREDFDIRDEAALREAIAAATPTDVVYSVGINELDWIKDLHQLTFRSLMEVNVWGFLSTIQQLQAVRTGVPMNVVAVTSDAAWRPMRTSAAYCASKAALEMAVRVASRELAGMGWRVNAVAPGKVEGTPMTRYVDQRVPEVRGWSVEAAETKELGSTPLGRKITKREVAEVIFAVLNGPAAQTGEIVAVNGGR
jgi:NAD(P)-dependent dehydrogenase (short-subunit alcohol dehydrogenase family)